MIHAIALSSNNFHRKMCNVFHNDNTVYSTNICSNEFTATTTIMVFQPDTFQCKLVYESQVVTSFRKKTLPNSFSQKSNLNIEQHFYMMIIRQTCIGFIQKHLYR